MKPHSIWPSDTSFFTSGLELEATSKIHQMSYRCACIYQEGGGGYLSRYLHWAGLKQVGDFLKIRIDGNDKVCKWWWSVSVNTYPEKNKCQILGKTDCSVASQNSYWRFQSSNLTLLRILCPSGQLNKQYGQIVWSPFPHPTGVVAMSIR